MSRSLEFRNLPLIEVSARLVWSTPACPKLDLATVCELAPKFPDYRVSSSGTLEPTPGGGVEFQLSPGDLASVTFDDAAGLEIFLQSTMLRATWHRNANNSYPRFSRVVEAIESFLERTTFRDSFGIANFGYTNQVDLDGEAARHPLEAVLQERYWPSVLETEECLREVNYAWETASGIERRLLFARVRPRTPCENPKSYVLGTVAGRRLSPEATAASALGVLHDDLQNLFEDVLTDRVKREWGFVDVGR